MKKYSKTTRYVIKSLNGYVRRMNSNGYKFNRLVPNIEDAHLFRRMSDAKQAKTVGDVVLKVKVKIKVIEE